MTDNGKVLQKGAPKSQIIKLEPRTDILPPVRHDVAIELPALQTSAMPIASRTHESFDVVKQAQATLIHAKADIAVFGAITFALVVLLWLMQGGDLLLWGFGGLLAWGLAGLLALNRNRAQGFYHSPSGVDHHEIDSRERIALHAIDRHADIIEEKYRSL